MWGFMYKQAALAIGLLLATSSTASTVLYKGGATDVADDGSFLLMAQTPRATLRGVKAPFREACAIGEITAPCWRISNSVLRVALTDPNVVLYEDAPTPAGRTASGYIERDGKKVDLAKSLVEAGWLLDSGGTFQPQEAAARDARRGIWGMQR